MRRFLLALPLFLVIGLATPTVTASIAPNAPLPQPNIEGTKRGPKHGGFEEREEDDEDYEDDDFEDDDD